MATPSDELGQAKRARFLFAVTLAGLILYLVLDAVVQSLPPHYSPMSQAESDLAVGPYGYIMAVNFINRGVLSLCFIFALALTANSFDTMGAQFRKGGWLFGVWSVGAFLLAVFSTDVPATPISWHGAIHLVVAILAFLGGAFGALYLSWGMAGNRPLERAKGVAVPLSYLAVALCAVEILAGVLPGAFSSYGGLIERLFLASVLVWEGAVSVVMLVKPKSQEAIAATS